MLDQRLLQEREVARGWSVPETAYGGTCLLDVEGRDTDDAGTVADRRLVWVGWDAPNVVRREIAEHDVALIGRKSPEEKAADA